MLQKSARLFLGTQDQPKVFNGVQRFRTISNQPFLNRGTVRRGGLGVSSILRFASELKNRLLHIFRLEAKASRSGRRKEHASARAASVARRVEDINGRLATASLRDVEGNRLCRRRHSCAVSAADGHRCERSEGMPQATKSAVSVAEQSTYVSPREW